MVLTLLTLGWIGDLYRLKKSAQRNIVGHLLYRLYCIKHQCFIGINSSIAQDVIFPHFTGIHINSDVVVGSGCTIYQHVTLGANRIPGSKHNGAPIIGNNVFIGANACIVGGVKIGNNVRIGAGCVVVEDIPDGAVVVMQKPRIIIKKNVEN